MSSCCANVFDCFFCCFECFFLKFCATIWWWNKVVYNDLLMPSMLGSSWFPLLLLTWTGSCSTRKHVGCNLKSVMSRYTRYTRYTRTVMNAIRRRCGFERFYICYDLHTNTAGRVSRSRLIADSGLPQLRSAHANVLTVARTNIRLGDRSFSVADPRIWNSLPASLRQTDIEFGHFERLLKAFLFGETAAH